MGKLSVENPHVMTIKDLAMECWLWGSRCTHPNLVHRLQPYGSRSRMSQKICHLSWDRVAGKLQAGGRAGRLLII